MVVTDAESNIQNSKRFSPPECTSKAVEEGVIGQARACISNGSIEIVHRISSVAGANVAEAA